MILQWPYTEADAAEWLFLRKIHLAQGWQGYIYGRTTLGRIGSGIRQQPQPPGPVCRKFPL